MQRPDDDDAKRSGLRLEAPPLPWSDGWTAAEREHYDAGGAADERYLHVDGSDGSDAGDGTGAPGLVRETLLAMWTEAPGDDDVHRELWRQAAAPG